MFSFTASATNENRNSEHHMYSKMDA
uniref:Uncharacterized protein n=1 Tax=Arundo donax TaxID=35708 RepID=A0A0A8YHB1_ARUDO